MQGFTRRGFLWSAAATASAIATGSARAIPPIGRSRPSHMKLSLAAYSYRDLLTAKPPKMDLFDFVNLGADLGLDGSQVGSAGARQEVTDVADADARAAGEIVVDEGDGYTRVIEFLEQLKVL